MLAGSSISIAGRSRRGRSLMQQSPESMQFIRTRSPGQSRTIRNVLPPMGGLDFSPMVLFALQIVKGLLV
jgi:uncharacterized protein YggT (Ycf19 family)